MELTERRCRSEQLPRSEPTAKVVPPHKAAKLREAQLLRKAELKNGTPATERPDIAKRVESSSHPDAPAPNTDQTKSYDTRDTGKKSQLDGASHFPSIDTVIAGTKRRDKDKTKAETELYEHTDDTRNVRRRSIMRTVNKDDCLMVRGANPRTGLITPDANSVADSLEREGRQLKREKVPSAQWMLEGDQWVSVMPHEQGTRQNLVENPMQDTDRTQLVTPNTLGQAVRSGTRNASPLTESNLRTLSDQEPQKPSSDQFGQPSGTPPSASKVRRKPVERSTRHIPAICPDIRVRHPSNGTVVRTPGPEHPQDAHGRGQYFSPDDVGYNLRKESRMHQTSQMSSGMPFLGVPVRPREITMAATTRGPTGKNKHLNQLQQSLRTNNGPYPSPASSRPLVPLDNFEQLLLPSSAGLLVPGPGASPVGPRARHRPAQRVCPPDLAASFDDHIRPTQVRRQKYETTAQSAGRPLRRQEIPFDHTPNEVRRHQTSNFMSTSTSMPTITFGEQEGRSDHSEAREKSFLRHPTQRQEPAAVTDNSKCPPAAHDGSRVYLKSISCPQQPAEPERERRPLMGPRALETLSIPRARDGKTITASRCRSSRIGIVETPSDESDASDDVEGQDENQPPIPANTGLQTDPGDKLLDYDPAQLEVNEPAQGQDDERGLRDHSMCCPECCIQFDCHDGCLGHPSPAASLADSATSSLLSMGVFDSSFQTSVKAINKALLEPEDRRDSTLAKIMTVLTRPQKTRVSPPAKPSPKAFKRTMRDSPTAQTTSRPKMHQSIQPDPRHAAKAALGISRSLHHPGEQTSLGHRAADAKSLVADSKVPKRKEKHNETVRHQQKPSQLPGANEGRRVFSIADDCSPPARSDSLEASDDKGSLEAWKADNARTGVLHRMSSLLGCSSLRWSYPKRDSTTLSYATLTLSRLRDMVTVVLDTFTVLSSMAFEYQRTGVVALPSDVSASLLLGNCIRSTLYLMIAACVYTWVVKVSRVVLVVLRFVLLPVRICAWVIG